MKQGIRRVRRFGRTFFNAKIIVALCGGFLSVALHELFHIVVHWGHITEIEVFSHHAAIVTITSRTSENYNVIIEEMIAYAITLITALITILILYRMYDIKDSRSFVATVFPRDKAMQQLSPEELYELAARIKLV